MARARRSGAGGPPSELTSAKIQPKRFALSTWKVIPTTGSEPSTLRPALTCTWTSWPPTRFAAEGDVSAGSESPDSVGAGKGALKRAACRDPRTGDRSVRFENYRGASDTASGGGFVDYLRAARPATEERTRFATVPSASTRRLRSIGSQFRCPRDRSTMTQ
jgi:hypothetical protein